MKKTSILALLFLYSLQASATQIIEASNDAELTAFISQDDLSRIKVIADRIKSVKSNEGEVEILDDNNLGEIYIRPSRNLKDPINLFITTEKGHTYKLFLMVQNQPSEQIFIKDEEGILSSIKALPNKSQDPKEEIVNLIKGMREGREIDGYVKSYRRGGIQIGEFSIQKVSIFKGINYTGEVYKLANKSKQHLNLNYNEIQQKLNVQAISVDKEELDSNEKTKLYVVKEVSIHE